MVWLVNHAKQNLHHNTTFTSRCEQISFLFGNNTEAVAFSKMMGWTERDDQIEIIAHKMESGFQIRL